MNKVIKALLNTKHSAEASSSAERLQKVDIRMQGAMLRINVFLENVTLMLFREGVNGCLEKYAL